MAFLRILAAAGFFVAGLDLGRANLGDTEAQCITRYGAESDAQSPLGYDKVGDKSAFFHVKLAGVDVAIQAVFLNGRVCHEEIANADESSALSMDQMKAILNLDAGDQKWHKRGTVFATGGAMTSSAETHGYADWERSDGATARFWLSGQAQSQTQTGNMELSTKQYAAAQAYLDKQDGAN